MLFADITIVDENMMACPHMYVGVKSKHITYISDTAPEDTASFGRIYPGKDKLLIPGFFNAHSHAAMHLLRGYGENLPLHLWLTTKMFPFENHLTPDDVYWGTLAGVAEMLRFGIVSASDMYMHAAAMTQAFFDSGLKANIALGVTCSDPDICYCDTGYCSRTLELRERFHGVDSDRIRVDFGLHAEYTSTRKIAQGVAEIARREDGRIHIHASETRSEVEGCRQRYDGMTPIQYFEDCGIFDVPCTAAHCVHIDDNDIAILSRHGVSVASCPKSNLKLASGFCPADKLLAADVNIAISTDSVASNNNLNMLEEAKFFALIHKGINADPTLITPAQALYCATRGGALAQGREDCGLIKEGFRADLAVVDVDRIYMSPEYNIITNLIYSACGSDICLTMADGRVLYEEGNYPDLDIRSILAHSTVASARILGELAAEGI